MNDIFEMLADLKELQKLYALQELCYLDFQEKIAKYEGMVDDFERDMEAQEELYANG